MTGIVCINKDKNITSFGIVSKVRGIMKEKKAGHTGTLDPMATGVLPIMLGGATKFLDFLPDSDKGYTAGFILGKTTDTLDITGTVTGEYEVHATQSDVKKTAEKFLGVISQVPPMYSAVSVGGKRLYEFARRGIDIKRQARQVEIKKLEVEKTGKNEYEMRVLCSKGTYIRTLIDDIGRELGCGAVMISLERTLAMGFTLEDCVTLDEMQMRRDSGEGFEDVVFDLETIFHSYHDVCISAAQTKRFSNGAPLDLDRIKGSLESGLYRVYSPDNIFIGLGECDLQKNELSVKRLLVRRD